MPLAVCIVRDTSVSILRVCDRRPRSQSSTMGYCCCVVVGGMQNKGGDNSSISSTSSPRKIPFILFLLSLYFVVVVSTITRSFVVIFFANNNNNKRINKINNIEEDQKRIGVSHFKTNFVADQSCSVVFLPQRSFLVE